MEDKRFDLTPRQILSHLLDIEKKAPRDKFRIFLPSAIVDSTNPDLILVEEARKMLEFVGLYGYDLDVTYAKTGEGTGGDCQNNGTERAVHIHVSNSFRNNWKASLAVLAHEICHKVLFVKGLYSPIDMMNEVYAELATIYFGFGDLVLEGYQAKDHCLGYLKPETYKKINMLVCVVCGNIPSEVLNLKDIDPLADEAISVWERDGDKSKLLKDCFINTESQLSEFSRNISLLEQILKQCREDRSNDYKKINNLYFKENDVLKEKNPIKQFLFIYDYYCGSDYHDNRIEELNAAVNEALFVVYSAYQNQKGILLNYDFKCPMCSAENKNTEIKNRLAIVKCNSCGSYYTFNTKHWNPSVHQRKIDLKRQEEKKVYERMVDDQFEKIQREADHRISRVRNQTTEKIDEIRRNEQQRCKEEILKKIPSCLRWMVEKYIK